MSADRLCREACELGDEAIRIAFTANALDISDPRRWPLSSRMLEINHRLKEITQEIHSEDIGVNKMRIALFRSVNFDYVTPWDKVPTTADYIQISGWAEVDFPPLGPDDQQIANELEALAKRQKTFEEDFRRQRRALEDERAALLKTGT